MAGVLPHAAERAGLRLAAEPAEPPLQTDVRPAAELQQQTALAQEPPGGSAAGEPQEMTPPTERHVSPCPSLLCLFPPHSSSTNQEQTPETLELVHTDAQQTVKF